MTIKDLGRRFSNRFFAFITKIISNNILVAAYEFMRRIQKLIRNDSQKHLIINRDSFSRHADTISRNKGYIEDQNNYTDMIYGKSTMQYSGCEVFAVYNAIYSILGHHIMDLPEMICCFEKDGMALNGKFGTSPKALRDFLDSHGFQTSFSTKEKDFDILASKYPSLILTMYNDGSDIRREVHTVHISKNNGSYTAHNVYCNGTVVGPYHILSELIKNINRGRAKGIALIGIRKV